MLSAPSSSSAVDLESLSTNDRLSINSLSCSYGCFVIQDPDTLADLSKQFIQLVQEELNDIEPACHALIQSLEFEPDTAWYEALALGTLSKILAFQNEQNKSQQDEDDWLGHVSLRLKQAKILGFFIDKLSGSDSKNEYVLRRISFQYFEDLIFGYKGQAYKNAMGCFRGKEKAPEGLIELYQNTQVLLEKEIPNVLKLLEDLESVRSRVAFDSFATMAYTRRLHWRQTIVQYYGVSAQRSRALLSDVTEMDERYIQPALACVSNITQKMAKADDDRKRLVKYAEFLRGLQKPYDPNALALRSTYELAKLTFATGFRDLQSTTSDQPGLIAQLKKVDQTIQFFTMSASGNFLMNPLFSFHLKSLFTIMIAVLGSKDPLPALYQEAFNTLLTTSKLFADKVAPSYMQRMILEQFKNLAREVLTKKQALEPSPGSESEPKTSQTTTFSAAASSQPTRYVFASLAQLLTMPGVDIGQLKSSGLIQEPPQAVPDSDLFKTALIEDVPERAEAQRLVLEAERDNLSDKAYIDAKASEILRWVKAQGMQIQLMDKSAANFKLKKLTLLHQRARGLHLFLSRLDKAQMDPSIRALTIHYLLNSLSVNVSECFQQLDNAELMAKAKSVLTESHPMFLSVLKELNEVFDWVKIGPHKVKDADNLKDLQETCFSMVQTAVHLCIQYQHYFKKQPALRDEVIFSAQAFLQECSARRAAFKNWTALDNCVIEQGLEMMQRAFGLNSQALAEREAHQARAAAEKERLKAAIERQSAQLQSYDSQLKTLRAAKNEAIAQRKKSNQQKTIAERSIKQLTNANSALKTAIEAEQQSRVAELQQVEQNYGALQSAHQALKSRLEDLQQMLTTVQAKLRVSDAQTQAAQADRDEAESQRGKTQVELERVTVQLEATNVKLTAHVESIKAAIIEKQDLERQVSETTEALLKLTLKSEAQQTELHDSEQKGKQLAQQLSKEQAAAQAKAKEQTALIEKQASELEALKAQLAALQIQDRQPATEETAVQDMPTLAEQAVFLKAEEAASSMIAVEKIELTEREAWVMTQLQQEKAFAYIVGGRVRDALAGGVHNDTDIVTNCPEELVRILPGIEANPPVAGRYKDSVHNIDIQCVGALCLERQAGLRDFTVNALFYRKGKVFDPTKRGLSDLKEHRLSTITHPNSSFATDPSRIIRGITLSRKLNWSLSAELLAAIRLNAVRLTTLDFGLYRNVLQKLFSNAQALDHFNVVRELALLSYLINTVNTNFFYFHNNLNSFFYSKLSSYNTETSPYAVLSLFLLEPFLAAKQVAPTLDSKDLAKQVFTNFWLTYPGQKHPLEEVRTQKAVVSTLERYNTEFEHFEHALQQASFQQTRVSPQLTPPPPAEEQQALKAPATVTPLYCQKQQKASEQSGAKANQPVATTPSVSRKRGHHKRKHKHTPSSPGQ